MEIKEMKITRNLKNKNFKLTKQYKNREIKIRNLTISNLSKTNSSG